MESCWTILGVAADADERTVKRAYAKLLKQHRPDSDPEGFRRINDAYQQALARIGMAAALAAAGPDDEDGGEPVAILSAPAPIPAPAPSIPGDPAAPDAPAMADPVSAAPGASTPHAAPPGAAAPVPPDGNPPAPSPPARPRQPPPVIATQADDDAAALLAATTAPAAFADAALLDRWADAVQRLCRARPAVLVATLPEVAVAAAARGQVGAAMTVWVAWRNAGDAAKIEEYATLWSADNASEPKLVQATVAIANSVAISAPALAEQLGNQAFAAEPREAARVMTGMDLEAWVAIGRDCQPLPADVRALLAHLFAGGDPVFGDPLMGRLIRGLTTIEHGQRLLRILNDANPKAADAMQVERELRAMTPSARARLVESLAQRQWTRRNDPADQELIRFLGNIAQLSPLLREVGAVLPDLAAAANRPLLPPPDPGRATAPQRPGGRSSRATAPVSGFQTIKVAEPPQPIPLPLIVLTAVVLLLCLLRWAFGPR